MSITGATPISPEHTRVIDDRDEFYEYFTAPKGDGPTPAHAGFALTHWSGDADVEEKINNDLSVSIRCVPLAPVDGADDAGTCPFSGKPSAQRVVWAKSY